MDRYFSESEAPGPKRLSGRVVSRGTGAGVVYILPSTALDSDFHDLADKDLKVELTRLDVALASVADQLRGSIDSPNSTLTESVVGIIAAQIAILEDTSFRDKVRDRIISNRFGAQLALRVVTDEYVDIFRSLDDAHLQEKAADLQDICDRVLTTLSGRTHEFSIPKGAVIVAREVWPSTVLSLIGSSPVAIVTETGGWTSHSFILAREMGIPAISGVKNATKRLSSGEVVFVDAIRGKISIAEPQDAFERSAIASSSPASAVTKLNTRLELSDGTILDLIANVDSTEKCREALASGVTEIGLLRSEYLFTFNGRLPDEITQGAAYQEIGNISNGRPVAIRIFDVSIGQIIAGDALHEKNPALGMRSIRLALRYERQFRSQLRSILRANVSANFSIVIPMVSGAGDIQRVRSLIDAEFESLASKNVDAVAPKVGAMIELPSAVLTIDQVLEEVDFVCIGTNDLVQYTLGVDRDNETVADWYQTLHPAILRSISSVVSSASDANKPVTICGESAGSPFYLPLLLGLGVRRLSMNPSSIPSMAKYANDLDVESCRILARKLMTFSVPSKIEVCLAEFCFDVWPELSSSRVNFPPSIAS